MQLVKVTAGYEAKIRSGGTAGRITHKKWTRGRRGIELKKKEVTVQCDKSPAPLPPALNFMTKQIATPQVND